MVTSISPCPHIINGVQGFIQRGGTGGIYPPHDFGKGGGISPPSNCRTVFFLMGILVKSFKKVFRRQIPFFSKFVFSNCPPPHINFFLAETLECILETAQDKLIITSKRI